MGSGSSGEKAPVFVSLQTCCFGEPIIVYNLLVLTKILRAKISVGERKSKLGI